MVMVLYSTSWEYAVYTHISHCKALALACWNRETEK